jgi:hypothetical protein
MAERTTEEFIYEYWDCPKCSHKGIRGDEYKCGNCGYPRDNTITFYRKTEEEKIESKEDAERFAQGPDWVCSFCESLNQHSEEQCKGCGATKEDSNKNYFEELKRREEKTKPSQTEPEEQPKKKKTFWIWAGALGTILSGFICWGTSTHTEVYKVDSVEWTRAIQVQKYKWQERSDWQNEVSGDDVQVLSKKSEIKRYDKVPSGTRTETYTDTERYKSGTREECSTSYKSTGSGASKKTTTCRDVPTYSTRNVTKTRQVTVYRDVPVFDTKIYYKAKFYVPIGYVWKKAKDNSPIWPTLREGYGLDQKPDIIGDKLESLVVKLEKESGSDGPQNTSIEVTEDLFKNQYKVGNQIELKVNNFGSIQFANQEKNYKEEEYKEKFETVFKNSLNE